MFFSLSGKSLRDFPEVLGLDIYINVVLFWAAPLPLSRLENLCVAEALYIILLLLFFEK